MYNNSIIIFILIFFQSSFSACKIRNFHTKSELKTIQIAESAQNSTGLEVRAFWFGQRQHSEDPDSVYSGKCDSENTPEIRAKSCKKEKKVVPKAAFLISLDNAIAKVKLEIGADEVSRPLRASQLREQEYLSIVNEELAQPGLSETMARALAANKTLLLNRLSDRTAKLAQLAMRAPENTRELENVESLKTDLINLLNASFTIKYKKTSAEVSSGDSSGTLRAHIVWRAFFETKKSLETTQTDQLLKKGILELALERPISITFKSPIRFTPANKNQPIKSVPAALIGKSLFVNLGSPEVNLDQVQTRNTKWQPESVLRTSLSDITFGKPYCRMEVEMKPSLDSGVLEYSEKAESILGTYETSPSLDSTDQMLVFHKIDKPNQSLFKKFYLSCGYAAQGVQSFKDGKNHSQTIDFGLFGDQKEVTARDFAEVFSGDYYQHNFGDDLSEH